MDKKIIGIDIKRSLEKPDNWDDIKSGFTQAHSCDNCGIRWIEQLEWNEVALNSIIKHDYCTECYDDRG